MNPSDTATANTGAATTGRLQAGDIMEQVREVLQRAAAGKGTQPNYVTAFHILERLPASLRQRLIDERGLPGQGGGGADNAAQVVANAAEMLSRRNAVDIAYLDNRGVLFEVGGR